MGEGGPVFDSIPEIKLQTRPHSTNYKQQRREECKERGRQDIIKKKKREQCRRGGRKTAMR